MDPLRLYEYLETARRHVFDAIGGLTPEQRSQELGIGPGTIRKTLTHVLISEWYYIERLQEHEVPPYETWAIRDEDPPEFSVLVATWAEQAARTKAALGAVNDWDAPIEYLATGPDFDPTIVTTTRAGIATQLVLHEMHHRAQLMHMCKRLGRPVGEIDYNALMYGRRPAN